jgi:hypothetical protein
MQGSGHTHANWVNPNNRQVALGETACVFHEVGGASPLISNLSSVHIRMQTVFLRRVALLLRCAECHRWHL